MPERRPTLGAWLATLCVLVAAALTVLGQSTTTPTGPAIAVPSFADQETPGGAINGSNANFTLVFTPNPAPSLELFLNGELQTQGVDYTISGNVVTFISQATPQTADVVKAWYRH